MGKSIGIISIKGGVGKTTISASLAAELANFYNKKVLLVDANFSAPNLGLHMDIIEPRKTIHHVLDRKVHPHNAIEKKFNVDIISGDYVYNKPLNYLKLKDKLKKLKRNYDFVVIDSSPTLNDELLSTMLASDALFVVTTPDYPTLSCTLKAAKLAKQRGKPIAGIIINKIKNPKYEVDLKEIEGYSNLPVVAKMKEDKNAIKSVFTRQPINIYNKKAGFSKEINKLCAALTQNVENKPFLKKLISFNYKPEEINRELLKEKFYKSIFKTRK